MKDYKRAITKQMINYLNSKIEKQVVEENNNEIYHVTFFSCEKFANFIFENHIKFDCDEFEKIVTEYAEKITICPTLKNMLTLGDMIFLTTDINSHEWKYYSTDIAEKMFENCTQHLITLRYGENGEE